MGSGFLNLFRVPEIRRKILATLGLLLCYRIGFHVFIPGVDYAQINNLSQDYGFAFGIMNALSGGAIGSLSLFTLGVMPYISASIIFSLLVKVIPQLEALSKEGQAGQRVINRYTRYATVPICIIQAMFMLGLFAQNASNGVIVPEVWESFWYKPFIILTLTTGTLIIMWIGEQITEYGVGNGVSLIIMAGIVAQMPAMLEQLGNNVERTEWIQSVATLLVLYVLIVFGIVYVTKGQRRIPIQQGRRMRGRLVYGGQKHYLPLKVNQAGVMPIIFASFLFVVPTLLDKILGGLIGNEQYFQDVFRWGGFWYILFYAALVFMFSFFWTSLMFQPKEIANNLKEYGGFVPGLRPGARTAEFLESVMFKVTLAGATFLCIIAVLPQLLTKNVPNMHPMMAMFLGGTSVLIVVGVILDLVDKINAMLLMRRYEGLGESGGGGWARKGRKAR